VVTALGQNAPAPSRGDRAADRAWRRDREQRENFFNALSGRVAASTSPHVGLQARRRRFVIRGSLDLEQQSALIIVDGLPLEQPTLNTGVLGPDRN